MLRELAAQLMPHDVGGFSCGPDVTRDQIKDFIALMRAPGPPASIVPIEEAPPGSPAEYACVRIARDDQPRFFAVIDAAAKLARIDVDDVCVVSFMHVSSAIVVDGRVRVFVSLLDAQAVNASPMAA